MQSALLVSFKQSGAGCYVKAKTNDLPLQQARQFHQVMVLARSGRSNDNLDGYHGRQIVKRLALMWMPDWLSGLSPA